jgi:lysine 2,3-aminomutase
MALQQWQTELQDSIRTPQDLVRLGIISEKDLSIIKQIHQDFPFSFTSHYGRQINWADPNDPLKKIVVPSVNEMDMSGFLDVGGEAENRLGDGVQMKYSSTALLLPVPACFSYCRFCFRKRLFDPNIKGEEILKNIDEALRFVRTHPSINNVLLTGGDPLMIKNAHLRKFLTELRKIDHVKIIRFGTRAVVFLPSRVTSDPELLDLLKETSTPERRVYVVNHFNHPKEITNESMVAADLLMKSGVILANQSVMLRGVNDSPDILRQLFNHLSEQGIAPYYMFQCKFISGSKHFRVPLHETCRIFTDATRNLNGLAKRVRLIMAHFSGKIEILGTETSGSERRIFLKYHQARDENQIGKIFSFPLPDDAYWLDDLPGVDTDLRFGDTRSNV